MKVLLINPPSIIEKTMNTQPVPIGLYSIQQILLNHGYQAQIENLSIRTTWQSVEKRLRELQQFDIVGITCFTRQRFSVAHLAEMIKKMNPHCFLCIGGPHASFLAEDILYRYPFIDCVIRDEGEITFLQLAEYLARQYPILTFNQKNNIEGISYRIENKVVRNTPRKFVKYLDMLPNILLSSDDLEFLKMSPSLLFHFPQANKDTLVAPILTSRGCAGKCRFCCNKAFWGTQRFCSGSFVIEQIEHYYHLGVRYFDFYDDNLTANIQAICELADYIEKHCLDIHWWCSTRADYVNQRVIEILERAGCFMISLGAESGSQIILNNIQKNLTVNQIKQSCKLISKSNIKLRLTISIGHQGENLKTIMETINLINETKPSQVALFVLKVYPGTPLYIDMVDKGLLSNAYWFDQSNDIVPFYTVENGMDELCKYQKIIEDSVKATIVKKYEDELGSVELDLFWGDSV